MGAQLQLLFVTTEIQWPLSFGGDIRKWNILQGLIQAGDVDVLAFRRELDAPRNAAFEGCRNLWAVSDAFLSLSDHERRLYRSTLGRGVLTLDSLRPYEYRCRGRSALVSEILGMVDVGRYDLIWIAGGRIAARIGSLGGRSSVVDGDDYEYVREWQLLRSTPWYGAKLWNYLNVGKLWVWERALTRHHSWVVRCSREDVERHPAANVTVIPNGTSVPIAVERQPERRVLFVGDLGYAPNSRGMEWFIDRVWPDIRRSVPDAILDIVGGRPSHALLGTNGKLGITVHGFVPLLDPFYETASVSVVPLFAGGGTRLKILESLARGVPAVSTTIGAFGIDADHDLGLDREDVPQQFADRCISLLRDPSPGTARALKGRDFVRQRFDWKVIHGKVAELARRVASSSAVVGFASRGVASE